MEWCYPAIGDDQQELRKHRYAAKYLWGIDLEQRAAKTSRALMLIAGDGHTNIFGPDVNSLDPETWYETGSGQELMNGLRRARLTAKRIPDIEALTDEDKAFEYFDELKFDVVLANPPFAGEIKDRKLLVRYELAQRALRRAGNKKQPKEERDVLYIERILKILKPGGRAAIVLPQGKFNNSTLAFIRRWILRRARLLAIVGLHPNTFKPHTGTKTSVLFLQKYTRNQLAKIRQVQKDVARICPDYESEITDVLSVHQAEDDVPEDSIPEDVADLIAETFVETSQEEGIDDSGGDSYAREARWISAEEELSRLKAELIHAKNELNNLDNEVEDLASRNRRKITDISDQWTGKKMELRGHLKLIREDHRAAMKEVKQEQKEKRGALKSVMKALNKQIPLAEREVKLCSNRGKLELILAEKELISTLKERWVATQVAKRLDYPIFMAVSDRGGKNNSGDYEYILDNNDSLVVNQDLVNYNLRADELACAEKIDDADLCVAESFVRFAQEQNFSFWDKS